MSVTPPSDLVRAVLHNIVSGRPIDILYRANTQGALDWLWLNGLITESRHLLTEQGEKYLRIIDKDWRPAPAPVPVTTLTDLVAWLRSLDPIEAIRIGALLTDGVTSREIAKTVDEITYAQTTAGGGQHTQAELAELVGVTPAAIAKRAGRQLRTRR
jgi:hypothetical protein